MQSIELMNRKSERGFTLVELAIVMIIIGLLIGGILKGQELIGNARVTATVAQVKGIDAATTTFQDKYDGMPGDLRAANTRLPAVCAANGTTACPAGGGNGRVDTNTPGVANTANGENENYFQHLAAADLISDIRLANGAVNGGFYPSTKIGGGFNAAFSPGNVVLPGGAGAAGAYRSGHYLTLTTDAAAAQTSTAITPTQAFRIDNKLDDSVPTAGSVFSTAGNCLNGTQYNEARDESTCGLYIRFHQ